MMSMNGFTLGFLFPKPPVASTEREAASSEKREAQPKTLVSTFSSEDAGDRPAPLSLYAYRFF